MATSKRRSSLLSRGWYAVAFAFAMITWATVAIVLGSRLSGSAERMIRVIVPGETELRLNEAGTYTVFHEYRSNFEGRDYATDDISGMTVTVRSLSSGAPVPTRTATKTSYQLNARHGRSMFQFDAAAPGSYVIAGAYTDGRREPQTILAIDRGFVGELLVTILISLVVAFGGTALAVGGAVYILNRRQRRLEAMRR